jgi:hypothetical protein
MAQHILWYSISLLLLSVVSFRPQNPCGRQTLSAGTQALKDSFRVGRKPWPMRDRSSVVTTDHLWYRAS